MSQAMENIFKRGTAGFVTDLGTPVPGFDSVKLSILDIYLEYVRDFGSNVQANLLLKVTSYFYLFCLWLRKLK